MEKESKRKQGWEKQEKKIIRSETASNIAFFLFLCLFVSQLSNKECGEKAVIFTCSFDVFLVFLKPAWIHIPVLLLSFISKDMSFLPFSKVHKIL